MLDAEQKHAIGGCRCAFCLNSLHGHQSDNLYPCMGHHTDDAFSAIQHFASADYIERLYLDDAREIRKACRQLCYPSESAQSGQPHNNARAENLMGEQRQMRSGPKPLLQG